MSTMVTVIACALMVFLATALMSEWAARRLVSRIEERIFPQRPDRCDED